MTQRVVEADVRAIFPTFSADISLQPFIETASVIVTERLAAHYTDARLIEIERWLAAHLASQGSTGGSGQVSETRAEEITVRYATSTLGEGLASSQFGQHVRLLDYKGILQADMTSTVARFSVH